MVDSRKFFKGKKITVMGLGLLGRGVGDVKFLAGAGADLVVTDLKSGRELAPSLRRLKKFKNIKYVLGRHRLPDFRGRDFIIKAAGVPLRSSHLAEARKNGIPVVMSTALFVKLAPTKNIVGVTGTRGKSTTSCLIYEILKAAGRRVHLGGNVRGVSTLALLDRVQPGDWVVLELDSWQLQGFGDLKISPRIAIFTNFMADHLNYYGTMKRYFADKAHIFKWQKPGDYQIWGGRNVVPKNWRVNVPGAHNLKNISCAVRAAEMLGVPKAVIKKAVESFRGLPGRLELVRVWRGVKIYNDTNATTPDATIAGLRAVGDRRRKKVVLIAGGADKNLDFTKWVEIIPRYCQAVVLLPGSGSARLKAQNFKEAKNLGGAVREALSSVKRGDVILFSPGFASFGMFKNEYDRGKKFVKLVRAL